jgi:hypothetical protein
MATAILTSLRLELNGQDLSVYNSEAELEVEVESKDATTFGSAGWREKKAGLKSGKGKAKVFSDYADNLSDELVWAMLGATITFKGRPTSAAVSAGNPEYQGSCIVTRVKPVAGVVGDLPVNEIEFETTGAVTRAVA